MKLGFITNCVRWIAATLSLMTMVFAPLAQAKQSERLTQQQLQTYLISYGLNKQTTLGEFWEKTKPFYPGQVYNDIEQFVERNRNVAMPEVSLTSTKSTDGREVPTLRLYQNGRTHTMQFFGEKNRWIRFNGVDITENELKHLHAAVAKMEASDATLRRDSAKSRVNTSQNTKANAKSNLRNQIIKKDFARFDGFPRVTPQMWKAMKPFERANYIVKMRLLWEDAQKVNTTARQNSLKKKKKEQSSIQQFYKAIFGQPASAQGIDATRPRIGGRIAGPPPVFDGGEGSAIESVETGDTLRVRTDSGATATVTVTNAERRCVVAGYIGLYGQAVTNYRGRSTGCSSDLAFAIYNDRPDYAYVREANETCRARGAQYIACNPVIYGYPNGQELCVDRSTVEFQQATHWSSVPRADQTCDAQSRLGTSPDTVRFTPNARNYKDDPLYVTQEQRLQAIEADQAGANEDYALTKAYLDGVLKKRNSDWARILADDSAPWTPALDAELVKIQKQFEEEITSAINTCVANADNNIETERNQKGACDQLHRRWLFTERFIAKFRNRACVDGSRYVGMYATGQRTYGASADQTKNNLNKNTISDDGRELCECPASEGQTARKVNFGQSCSAATPPPVVGVCPDNSNSVPDGNGGQFCQCRQNPQIQARPGEPLNCSVTTCDKPQGIAGFNYETCQCEGNKELKQENGQWVCKDKKKFPWLLVGGLAAIAALIALASSGNDDDPRRCNGQINPQNPNQCGCRITTCPAGQTLNPAQCSCDPNIQPPLCTDPLKQPVQTESGIVCQCTAASQAACVGEQKIYNQATCQCEDRPQQPRCDDNSIMPRNSAGEYDRTLCPKCPPRNEVYRTTQNGDGYVNGCRVESGNGDNCPSGGCNGGVPTTPPDEDGTTN